jgi:hypothetical protein
MAGNSGRPNVHWAENEPLEVVMTLTNKGKTPAKHMIGHAFIEKLKVGEAPHFGRVGSIFTTGIVVPSAPFNSWGFSSGTLNPRTREKTFAVISKQDLEEFQLGKSLAVTHGIVAYDDMFGTPHWIKFCTYNASIKFISSLAIQNSVASCTENNATDDN